jgi:predicted hydrocarbon binding protein
MRLRIDKESYRIGYEDGRAGSPAKQRDELQDGMDEWSYVSGWIDGDATRTATP